MSNKVHVKVKVKYQKVNQPEISPNDEEFDHEAEETEEQSHPLESSNFLVTIIQYVFHIWVFKLISIYYVVFR